MAFPPFDVWPLGMLAIVPYLLALRGARSTAGAMGLSLWTGALFWAVSLYWLTWITLVGYVPLVVYLTLYWLAAGLILRPAMRRGLPAWLAVPVVWVALEYVRAYVISGFPWFYLGHTQYTRPWLIQVADLSGVYGVSFFVALFNGLVVDVLTRRLGESRQRPTKPAVLAGLATAGVLTVGLIAYGQYRLGQWPTVVQPGPRVGVVQHAFPVSLFEPGAPEDVVLSQHIEQSHSFAAGEIDLLLWPETVLPKGLNPEMLAIEPDALGGADLRSLVHRFAGPGVWELDDDRRVRGILRLLLDGGELASGTRLTGLEDYAAAVASVTRRLECPLLAGGSAVHRNDRPIGPRDAYVVRNSALWFDQSPIASGEYAKMHLVPFSEYVPFKYGWTSLHRALRWFVPPVMEQLDPGRQPGAFELTAAGRTFQIVSPICYEGTFARVCRDLVMTAGRKRPNCILANLSNDGWFVRRVAGGAHRGSTEHRQHLAQYCFRAVELRVPVVRAVNTGISGSIDSSGRIVALVGDGEPMTVGTMLLSDAPPARPAAVSTAAGRVLVDSRTTLYSLAGDLFAQANVLAGLAILGWLIGRRKRATKEGEGVRP
jgi:apolipoprotein N-acyltransferase